MIYAPIYLPSLHPPITNNRSKLAVVPSASGWWGTDKNKQREPDFINLQAIIARSLTMNLAYPQIQDAMSELLGAVPFSKAPTLSIPNP